MFVRYASRLLAPLLAVATMGCAPSYLLGVQPAQPHTLFGSGQPAAEAAADSVALRLDFLGYEPEYLVFHAEYHNDSRRPIEIVPEAFAYAPVREAGVRPPTQRIQRIQRGERVPAAVAAATQHLPWPALPPAPLAALDPEPQIVQLQNGATHEAQKASRTDWVSIALFAVALGTDIASTTRRRPETFDQAQTRAVIHNVAWAYNAVSTASRVHHAATAEALAQRAAQLNEFALRRVILQPGQQVRGYVYLPRFDHADGLEVLAPVGRQQVALSFVQSHQRR
jgi:hypothetical protein